MRYSLALIVLASASAQAAVVTKSVSDNGRMFTYTLDTTSPGSYLIASVTSPNAALYSLSLSLMPSNNIEKGNAMVVADLRFETTLSPQPFTALRDTLKLDASGMNTLTTNYSSSTSSSTTTHQADLAADLLSFTARDIEANLFWYGHPMNQTERGYRVSLYGDWPSSSSFATMNAQPVPEPGKLLIFTAVTLILTSRRLRWRGSF